MWLQTKGLTPGLRLTLYLPGLGQRPVPGPAEALLAGLALPAIERLFTRGDGVAGPAGDPDAGLFELLTGAPGVAPPPSAAVARLAEGLPAGGAQDWWLRADPVHLRPDLSKLVLFDARALRLEEGEARVLAAAVAPLLAEAGAALEVAAPGRWYLRLDAPVELQTHPLCVVAGQDLRGHLPAGGDTRRFRALLTEVEMTLSAHAVNAAREARGAPPVNGLWPWGGGRLPAAPARRWSWVLADDPLARGLATLVKGPCGPFPASATAWLAEVRGDAGDWFLFDDRLWRAGRYGDLDAWREGLEWVEAEWVVPLLEAVRRGDLAGLTVLVGAGLGVRVTRGALRRWWRRRRLFVAPTPGPAGG